MFVEGFLTSNEQHLKDGLRKLSLHFGSTALTLDGYFNSFKVFTKLDSIEVTSWSDIPTSSLASFLHQNKVWSNLTDLHLDSGHPLNLNQMLSIAALPLLADTLLHCPQFGLDRTESTGPGFGPL